MPKYAILSRSLLLDLNDGEDVVAEELIYLLRVKGFTPAVTPTMVRSLADMAEVDRNRAAAGVFFGLERGLYGIQYPTLDPVREDPEKIRVGNDYACLAADEIIRQGGLSEEKKNVARIISEAAVMQAAVLILDKEEQEGLDLTRTNSVLGERSLSIVPIRDKWAFLKYVQG